VFIAITLHGSIAQSSQPDKGNTAKTTQRVENYGFAGIDDTQHFIFFSVLEGLYEDGVSKKDVAQILMKKDGDYYYHFIYACPVCEATIWALEAYQSRPNRFYRRKLPLDATLGPGLSEPNHSQLYDDDPRVRLAAINSLVKTWIDRRMAVMNFSPDNRMKMLEALEKKRKEGMQTLKNWKNGEMFYAPAYGDIDECAVCNAVVGKPMKMPEAKPHQ
jgi:hypothetical protein